MYLKVLLAFPLMMMLFMSYSQELSGISEDEPVTISGGVNVNSVFYRSKDTLSTREPFSFVVTGNVNLNLYNVVNCPISFTYSNYKANWSQPFNFNQFGMAPSYKWIKAYIGYNSMSFSDYTLSGHQFLGLGIEVSPDIPWKYAVMYGRLLKPVEEDTTNTYNVPAYARYGYATSVEYLGHGSIKLVLFKAWDDESSLSAQPVKTQLYPQSDLAFSISVSEPVGERFTFNGEFSTSALNTDTRNKEKKKDGERIFRVTQFLQKNTISTIYYCAYKSALKYTGQGYGLGVSYERVNPGYETLGAYYFTNDFENITFDASTILLKETLNISGRIGFQRNDLDRTNMSSTKKLIGSLNMQYAMSEKTSVSLSYSNFTGYTYIKNEFDNINASDPYQNIDTLKFTQINQSVSANISCRLGSEDDKNVQKTLNVNATIQNQTMQQNKLHKPGTQFYNGNVSYNMNVQNMNLGVFFSLNGNYNKIPEMDDALTVGPTIGGNKGWLENKLRITTSLSYNNELITNNNSAVWIFRAGSTYTLKEHHQFDLSFSEQNRLAKNQGRVNDLTFTVGYRYNFNVKYSEVFK
ncbi:MAG: hypothetical protein J6W13_07905 [Salinivirgaceae bacterium]|nr:hypothetical protein [Salinivirgaceae bacterium]